MNTKIEIKLADGVVFPEYATPGSAGLDLRARLLDGPITLHPGWVRKIPTGIFLNIKDPNIVAKIYPRSGMGYKGLVMANGTGIIDSDYQGEVMVLAWNRNTEYGDSIKVRPGDRIAQLVFEPVIRVSFDQVVEFSETTMRGAGAFGSTGFN